MKLNRRLTFSFVILGNAPQFESLVGGVIGFAIDTTYPPLQRTAFALLACFTTLFGAPEGSIVTVRDRSKSNATQELQVHHVPGFERVVYERLIPMAFDVPAAPNFNIKDGQSLQVRERLLNRSSGPS